MVAGTPIYFGDLIFSIVSWAVLIALIGLIAYGAIKIYKAIVHHNNDWLINSIRLFSQLLRRSHQVFFRQMAPSMCFQNQQYSFVLIQNHTFTLES